MDENGNVLIILSEYDNKKFLLSSIYGPNEDDPTFFSTLFNKLMSVDCPLQIIAGDFNVTLDEIFCGYF